MALTASSIQPWVVELGSGTISDNQWKASIDSVAGIWNAGEFLRKTLSGTVELGDAGAAAKVNFVALKTHAVADGARYEPILEIASDTIFAGQLLSGTPAQTDIGDLRVLDVTSQIWTVGAADGTEGNNQVEITGIWANDNWYNTGHNFAGAYGIVYFKFREAILNVIATAATAT